MNWLSAAALMTLAVSVTGGSVLAEEGTVLTGTLKTIKDREKI